jgi:hypothetical protein
MNRRMKPPRRYKGWSWVGVVNFLILQWFFVRLYGTVFIEDSGREVMVLSTIGPVVPLTGWWNDFWWLTRGK